MNLILLQHGYPIVILKGDVESLLKYYQALELAQVEGDKSTFIQLIEENVRMSIERILQIFEN